MNPVRAKRSSIGFLFSPPRITNMAGLSASLSRLSVDAGTMQWPVQKDDYEIIMCIGQGATSSVYKAVCVPLSSRLCAMKVVNLEKCSSSASLDEINREITSMKNLKHENIVTYHLSFVTGSDLYIVMDLCQRGSLLDLIKLIQSTRDITYGVFDENVIATILRDVLRGLAYIHENGLVHRDLKCGNLLVNDNGVIQISDFGVAGFLAAQPLAPASHDKVRFTFVGTPCWMAPEVMQQERGYNQKADIWSLGITTLELATGQAPYAKFPPMKVLMLTLQSDPPDINSAAATPHQYSNYGHKFRKFAKHCLMKDPSLRPAARDLLQQGYIKAKARDRELLRRVLLSEEVPPPAWEEGGGVGSCPLLEDSKSAGSSGEWNFNDSGTLAQCTCASDSDSDEDTAANGGRPRVQKRSIDQQISKVKDTTQKMGPTYMITLRKRNPNKNNELQDISFKYSVGLDTTEALARELVEAGLVDGCDFVLVAHNISELVGNTQAKERVFPLNSAPVPGQIPLMAELHGYAKVLIRRVDDSNSDSTLPPT